MVLAILKQLPFSGKIENHPGVTKCTGVKQRKIMNQIGQGETSHG